MLMAVSQVSILLWNLKAYQLQIHGRHLEFMCICVQHCVCLCEHMHGDPRITLAAIPQHHPPWGHCFWRQVSAGGPTSPMGLSICASSEPECRAHAAMPSILM